jgi:uncharacterized membrane protein
LFEFLFKYSPATFENGELLFASGWSSWLLVATVILAAGGIGYSVLERRESLGLSRLLVLAGLQAAVVAVVLVLLWQPALSVERLRAADNAVAVVLDTSASMSYGEGDRSRLQEAVAALTEEVIEDLAATFDLRLYAFSAESMTIEELDQVPPPGNATRIGDALVDVLREARSSALGAVVLVSDGADNSGELDANRLTEIAGFGVPVHTVGVGRESIPEDIELESVSMTSQLMPGSRVGAQVSIRHGQAGEARLKVYDGDAILASETLALPDRSGVTTHWVEFDVGEAGVKDLRFAVDALPGEHNTVNNVQFRVFEVPEDRRRILYVEGEPRWEYKFIRRAVQEDSPVRLASLLRTTPNKFYRQGIDAPDELENGFPVERETLFAYDAVIIGSFEAAALTEAQQEMLRDFVGERGGSLLMLGGRRGLSDGGWGRTVLAEVLPARLPDVDAPSFMRVPVRVGLTADGEDSVLTRLDSDREANLVLWQEMPEIADFQYLDALKPGAVTLLQADVRGTAQPLLVHQRYGLGNAYILATGGTWRWQMQLPSEDQRHETFWRQMLHALATGVPRPVLLSAERPFYGDESEVKLHAEVRNKAYEPVGSATVSLTVASEAGATRSVEMRPVPGEPGSYEATLEAEETGLYRFEVDASLGEEPLGTASFAVRREDGVAEHFQIQQNRPLLERLAGLTGGQYFALGRLGALPEAIEFSEAGIVEREILDLWNMPIVFLLLLLLKGGEWVLRLFWGRL